MTLPRLRLGVAATAIALALAGCGDDQPDAAAPATTAPSPTAPATDYDRDACHRLSAVGDDVKAPFDAKVMTPIGAAAALASDPAIKQAGLDMAPIYAYGGPQPGQESVKAQRVVLDLAEACAAKYGDGPW